MRIIGGKLKGQTILPPNGYGARPTTDFAKEGLFNVLDNEYEFQDLKVLDLFGGTGAIAYEFASRGAARVYSIEMNKDHAVFIRKEAKRLGLDNVTSVHTNVFDFLPICREKFDIIFADPPYALEGLESIPDRVLAQDILHPGCYFILEHGGEHDFKTHPNFVKEKSYGRVHFSFFSK
ncbi:MAG TPA: 16S rRNA (guanine(966)-N(2))-methyltransferase RsmD [Rikenellaceae bacterium]|nr:16S rRNA (guanine(966)-N(2))-methyltransferase RsmD [Rikenellaceae bacterium]HBH20522.1 16S rRNA (guanine(966)-N(2))-methyltransferase RsmD [Rikenellaceae bacterium]HCZ22447.1 16S rRNA (guanine(966)-N(2))-methyltransferase RsmD [Rikenellaceae bacterium]